MRPKVTEKAIGHLSSLKSIKDMPLSLMKKHLCVSLSLKSLRIPITTILGQYKLPKITLTHLHRQIKRELSIEHWIPWAACL